MDGKGRVSGYSTTICDPVSNVSSDWSATQNVTMKPLRLENESEEDNAPEVYPNPFSSSPAISFTPGTNALVVIEVVDVAGRRIQTRLNASLESEEYDTSSNAEELNRGIYLLQYKADEKTVVLKIVRVAETEQGAQTHQGRLNYLRPVIPNVPQLKFAGGDNFFLIAGPCVVESEALVMNTARELQRITASLQIPFIFKSSYRKANRSKGSSFTGIGDEKALSILKRVGEELQVPVVTDVHSPEEAIRAAEFVDVLQIPAFLCRQTDLLHAAGKTGKWVNIKKGQFLAPEQMQFAADKVVETGNKNVMLTERGTTFGYSDLVVDYRGIPIMQQFGFPVILDCTHSLQKPNQASGVTGGMPQMIETIARAGIAVGVDGIFIETHPEPSKALSDGANMLQLSAMELLLNKLVNVRHAINGS
jgi:2-dehydro-3-deoxyphosphooctonate aldolase (KDO 8-P synthase)